MERIARFGIFALTLIIYSLVVLVISLIVTDADGDYVPWFAFGIGALAYAATMALKWAF